MAISWLTVLKAVPWTEVIRNAPRVADGAKKLWAGARRGPVADAAADSGSGPAAAPETRLAALEADVADLRAQLLAASDLIASLAEQNAQLIGRAEQLRWRLLALALAAVAALVLAAVALLRAMPP